MFGLDTEFAREHLTIDFSPESENREQIKRAIGARIEAAPRHEGSVTMKRTWRTGTKMILASALAVVLLSATAFAITALNLGPFAKYVQNTPPEASVQEIFEAHRADWQGKVFDENGKAIDDLAAYARTESGIYDANGRPAELKWVDDAFVVKPKESGELDMSQYAVFTSLEEVASYLSFTPRLPQSIPAGFALDRFVLYREAGGALPEAGKGKYLYVYYTRAGNPDAYIGLQVRLMDEETGYEASGEATREITINGYDAVTDGRNIDMLVGDVMYMFVAGKSGVSYDEVLKMAESVK